MIVVVLSSVDFYVQAWSSGAAPRDSVDHTGLYIFIHGGSGSPNFGLLVVNARGPLPFQEKWGLSDACNHVRSRALASSRAHAAERTHMQMCTSLCSIDHDRMSHDVIHALHDVHVHVHSHE